MEGLSVAHRVALTALLSQCSEPVLKTVGTAIAALPGGRAAELRLMLAQESLDRARRHAVFAPIAPMFRRRRDGVAAMTFPAGVLPRLWKAASEREPHLLTHLDDRDDPAFATVGDRICQAAALIVRDQPALIWPEGLASDSREQGLADLAACLDLAHLARRAMPSIEIWLKRPDADQEAELRLLVKDSAAVHDDGSRRLLEILFSHLEDAVLVLRILTRMSGAAGRETFLSASEMADFVERLLDGIEQRAARLEKFETGHGAGTVEAAIQDLDWCADVLAELDVTLTLDPGSAWGKQVRDRRVSLAKWLTGLFRAAEKAVDRALPLESMRIAGRMTRKVPQLSAAARGEAADTAFSLLKLVGASRGPTATFGCESDRKSLVDGLTERLSDYADQVLVQINEGEAGDEGHALRLVSVAARYLELIEAKEAARVVRRRAAVAGGPADAVGASSQAA